MKAYLKNGTVCEIDTQYLFNNQYNTTDGERIFDNEIARIEDDARINMGKCKYCGAMIKRGEEENHFKEREAKGCAGCWWFRERQSGETVREVETKEENGEKITITTEKKQYKKICTYHEAKGNATQCNLTECRAHGVEWFTPENTFFLKHPNGFSLSPLEKLKLNGFVFDRSLMNAEYYKKIGSYTLTAILKYENGKPTGFTHYRIYNCRNDYKFRYENGELFTDKYGFGWYQVKSLDKIPQNIMQAIKNICNN